MNNFQSNNKLVLLLRCLSFKLLSSLSIAITKVGLIVILKLSKSIFLVLNILDFFDALNHLLEHNSLVEDVPVVAPVNSRGHRSWLEEVDEVVQDWEQVISEGKVRLVKWTREGVGEKWCGNGWVGEWWVVLRGVLEVRESEMKEIEGMVEEKVGLRRDFIVGGCEARIGGKYVEK